jgi:hypothetical protein
MHRQTSQSWLWVGMMTSVLLAGGLVALTDCEACRANELISRASLNLVMYLSNLAYTDVSLQSTALYLLVPSHIRGQWVAVCWRCTQCHYTC